MSSMRDLQHAAPEDVGVSSTRLRTALEAVTRGYVDDGSKPSGRVAVARCGKVIYDDSYGYMDVESQTVLRDDAIYRLASMTKPITCVAAMICYERGCFQLDDPLSKFCPEWAQTQVLVGGDADCPKLEEQDTPITIKHLFTHTAGLPPLGPTEAGRINARLQRKMNPTNLAEHCVALAAGALSAQPGTKWQYGSGLTVLGRCVEVWSGRTFDIFLEEEIFAPLGMVDTGFKLAESKLHRLHTNYRKTSEQQMEPLETSTETLTSRGGIFNGSGGLVGTMADYMKFCLMLCNKGIGSNGARVLGPRSVEHMSMNHLPGGCDIAAMGVKSFTETTMEGIGFGLGMAVVLDPPTAHVMMNKGMYYWGGAFSTAFYIDPVEQICMVYLTQLSPSGGYPIRQQLRVAINQAIMDDVPPLVNEHGSSRL